MYDQFEAPNDFRCYILHSYEQNFLAHHGILGMKWGVRRYQNKDGSLTSAGRRHYGVSESSKSDFNNIDSGPQPNKSKSKDPDGFESFNSNSLKEYVHKAVDNRTDFMTKTKDLQRNDDLSARRTYQEYKKNKAQIDKNWDDAVFKYIKENYSQSDSKYSKISDSDLKKSIKKANRLINADGEVGELFTLVSYSLEGDDHFFEFEYSMKDHKARHFAMNG